MALHFEKKGSGQPIILLHGFPFNRTIWNDFAEKLSQSFEVFTPDLPGFGKSPLLKEGFSINDVAQEVANWIIETNIKSPSVIGHSLGGYVALGLAKWFPELISSICLFHSTALPDSVEKRQNRDKVLEFIKSNGVEAFTSNFISPLFADPNHPAIAKIRDIAIQAHTEAVTGYTKAMRDRDDRKDVLTQFPKPILFIAGDSDQGIPLQSVNEQVTSRSDIGLKVLVNTAHMGMFEKPLETLEIVKAFVAKSNRQYEKI